MICEFVLASFSLVFENTSVGLHFFFSLAPLPSLLTTVAGASSLQNVCIIKARAYAYVEYINADLEKPSRGRGQLSLLAPLATLDMKRKFE